MLLLLVAAGVGGFVGLLVAAAVGLVGLLLLFFSFVSLSFHRWRWWYGQFG